MLYCTATVAYTEPPLVDTSGDAKTAGGEAKVTVSSKGSRFTRVQIRVDSKVRDIEHGNTKPTGQFNYTFLIERNIKVMPRTYSEFMIWVDARRRAERVGKVMDEGKMAARWGSGGEDGKECVTE